MIHLSADNYIGEGDIRVCYYHPENKDMCIKIPRQSTSRAYTLKELNYFKKLARRDFSRFEYLFFSDFIEEKETNLGLGQVFELVRDETTGEISKTLAYYLSQETSIISDSVIDEALLRLKSQMINNHVFARDLRARNICCKILKDNSIELIIIDGLGHSDFFPFADWLKHFSVKKIERCFTRWHFNSVASQRAFLNKKK